MKCLFFIAAIRGHIRPYIYYTLHLKFINLCKFAFIHCHLATIAFLLNAEYFSRRKEEGKGNYEFICNSLIFD